MSSIKSTKYYNYLHETQQKNFFTKKQKKFIASIDNLYYSVFILDEHNENEASGVNKMLEELDIIKSLTIESKMPVIYNDELDCTLKSYSIYRYCLTNHDKYDIFIARELPNENTPRIVVQIRSYGLWTSGIEQMMNESYASVKALLTKYGLKIEKVRESRIDYCYHTNAITNPNILFKETDGMIKNMYTNLTSATIHADLKQNGQGTVLSKDYICLGKKESNNVRARIYNKVKEVIEIGYKSYFFDLWFKKGLISYYDKWCLEYAYEHKNIDYLHKAKLAFMVAHYDGKEENIDFISDIEKKLNSGLSLKECKKIADKYCPEITCVLNIEYETKRKFYYYSDKFIDRQKIHERQCELPLKRIYKIIDNRDLFLDYLTSKTLSFHKHLKEKEDEPKWMDWWKRLRNTKLNTINTGTKLVREYAYKTDKNIVQKRAVNSIITAVVYSDVQSGNFIKDISDLLADMSDNDKYRYGLKIVDTNGEDVAGYNSIALKAYSEKIAMKERILRNRKKRQ